MASSAGSALRSALRPLRGTKVDVTEYETPSYPALLDLYGSNAAIADAAGVPTAGVVANDYRRAHPRAHAKTVNRIRAKARRDRQTFLRNLQRYKAGTRSPDAGQLELIERLQVEKVRELAVDTWSDLADLLATEGLTTEAGLSFLSTYDDRERDFSVAVAFVISDNLAELISEREWEGAGEQFFYEWGRAYGVDGGFTVDEVEDLEISVGMRRGPNVYSH